MNRALVAVALLLTGSAFAAPRAAASTASFDTSMRSILGEYLRIQEALANDTLEGVPAAARKIEAAAKRLDVKAAGEHAKHFATLPKELTTSARTLAAASDIDSARKVFKDLSRPMVEWAGVAKPADVHVMYCSMVEGKWLQTAPQVRNPYYGDAMLACGEVITGKDATASHAGHAH